MYLAQALGVTTADEIDPSRPLKFGALELSVDAVREAIRIISEGVIINDVYFRPRIFFEPIYWTVEHRTEGRVEIFGFPLGEGTQLPTAVEIAIVKALAGASPKGHVDILSGGFEISIGPLQACNMFREVIGVRHPLVGHSLLFANNSHAIIDENIDTLLNQTAQKCLVNSFNTSPIKFRFLELYRTMEARFLADIKLKLISSFDNGPGAAISDSQDALKSEMNQIVGLAGAQKDAFEACWDALDQIKNTNRFVSALFRRMNKRKFDTGAKWETGAILIYQTRCSIVHSGEKDLIFESYLDGDFAIEILLPHVERAALLIVGIELA